MAKLNLRQKEIIARIVKQKIEEHVDKSECNDAVLRKTVVEYEIWKSSSAYLCHFIES